MNTQIPLAQQHCAPCHGAEASLGEAEIAHHLAVLPQWQRSACGKAIHTQRRFKNFAQSLAWVNQVGALAEAENHHPDVKLGWGYAEISLTTHDAGGITLNDIILASKIDALAS